MQRKSDGLLHAWGCSGLGPGGAGRVEHLFATVPRGRSRSAQGEGGGEARNLPGNASSDSHLLGNERSRGKSGDESSSCGGCERCGEPGAAGSRPPLAPYSGCSALVLSRNPISPGSCECACLYFSLSKAMTTYLFLS